MPVTQSAKKALRRDRRKTLVNLRIKTRFQKTIKAFRKSPTPKGYRLVSSLLDQAAKKKFIHQNKVNRLKSRLNQFLKAKKPQKSPAPPIKKTKK